MVESTLAISFVGTATTVQRGIKALLSMTLVDELLISGHIYDHAARLRSFETTAGDAGEWRGPRRGPTSLQPPDAAKHMQSPIDPCWSCEKTAAGVS
jgi:hypothetical protein